MAIAEYRLVHALPAQLEASLPSIDQLEAKLGEAAMKDFEATASLPRPARTKTAPPATARKKGKR